MVGAPAGLPASELVSIGASDPASLGFSRCRGVVLGVREARIFRPDLVVKFGSYLLRNYSKALGHELWALYEQVYMGLLQYAKAGKRGGTRAESDSMQTAEEYVKILSTQFPGSLRVKRLEGLMCEAKGNPELAMNEYESILSDDPNNLFAAKRQVALLRSRGKTTEAASKLIEYLEVVCSDVEAWLQLCDMYLTGQRFRKAAFCMEELLLINPMAYIFYIRYADILYTSAVAKPGSNERSESLRTARKYYCHSLELKPSCNLRALYGLLLCAGAVGSGVGKKAAGAKVETAELLCFARNSLLQHYAESTGGENSVMSRMVKNLINGLEEDAKTT